MKNKGFTLVELLAVIAILAILVIMALPAVLRMYRNARMKSFENEVKSIYKQAQNQIISDSLNLNAGGEKVYAGDIHTNTSTQGNLELQGGDKIKYCIVLDNSGNIKKLYVSNGTYMYMNENTNALKDINNIEVIDISGTDFITGLENCMETHSAVFDIGENVNKKIKQLANPTVADVTVPYKDTNITAILKSDTEPANTNKEAKNKVSASTSDLDIYMWYEDGIIYWWSEDNTPSLNSDSSYMFFRFLNLNNISGLSNFDVSHVTNMICMFSDNINLISLHGLENWNTENVTNMYYMFRYNTALTTLDGLENWDVSNVTNMYGMFFGHSSVPMNITNIDAISKWNVSKVVDMSAMFQRNKLTSLDALSNWKTNSLENMQSMFHHNNLTSIDGIKNWNVSRVTSLYGTFAYNDKLVTVDFSKWATDSLENTEYMFVNDTSLKTIYVSSKFKTNKINKSSSMFQACTSIKGGSNTSYNAGFTDATYARVDNPDDELPGYFTLKTN